MSMVGNAAKAATKPAAVVGGMAAALWAVISSAMNAGNVAEEWQTVIESAFVFIVAGGILWIRDSLRQVFGFNQSRAEDRLGKFKG